MCRWADLTAVIGLRPNEAIAASQGGSAHGHSAQAQEAKTVRPIPSVGRWEAKPVPRVPERPRQASTVRRQDKNSVGKRRLFRERRVRKSSEYEHDSGCCHAVMRAVGFRKLSGRCQYLLTSN